MQSETCAPAYWGRLVVPRTEVPGSFSVLEQNLPGLVNMSFGGLTGRFGGEGTGEEEGASLEPLLYVPRMSHFDQTVGTRSWGELGVGQ